MSLTPRPFQDIAISRGVDANLFLTDECGLGKKLTCVEIARRVQDICARPVLVVTTKSDTLQWKYEIAGQDPTIETVIGTVDLIWTPETDVWWLILHYEALVRHIKVLSHVKWSTVVLDEGHNIKNWQSQRAKATKKLKAFRKIVATGTPMDKSAADLWSPLEFLYPDKYRGKWRAFRAKHERGYTDGAGYWRTLPGAKNPTELSRELAPFMIGRVKTEVAPELPPNIQKVVHLKLTGAQASLYRRIQTTDDIIVTDESLQNDLFIGSKLAQMTREQQAVVMPSLIGSDAPSVKLDWFRSWREGNPYEPTIVFSNYRQVILQLHKEFDSHIVIGGEPLPPKWTKSLIFGTIKAASEALDFNFLRTAIFLDTTWSHLKMTQAINRIDRLSKTQITETIFLLAEGTIDELLYDSFMGKWDRYQLLRKYIAWRQGAEHPLLAKR